MSKKSDVSQLKKGDYLSEIQYYQVLGTNSRGISVVNERGMKMTIGAAIVEEGMYSANQHENVEEVTRTELVAILANAGDTVFTANFHKKPDIKALKGLFNDPERQVKTQVEMQKLLLGEERTMVGYLKSSDAISGRYQVIDLEDPKKLSKQIDQRTLNWIILRNVKYTVK